MFDSDSPVYATTRFFSYSTNSATTGTLCPSPAVFGPGQVDNFCSYNSIWSLHTGGANFLYADGHVSFLTYSVTSPLPDGSKSILEAMVSRNGGEVRPTAPRSGRSVGGSRHSLHTAGQTDVPQRRTTWISSFASISPSPLKSSAAM